MLGFAHVGGLIVGGGSAIAADRDVLRALWHKPSRLSSQLTTTRNTHSVVLVSLAVVIASGVMLAAADVDTFLHMRLFWAKMTLVGLLIVNGGFMRWAERVANSSRPRWRPLVITAAASLTLWLLTTLAGAALPNVH